MSLVSLDFHHQVQPGYILISRSYHLLFLSLPLPSKLKDLACHSQRRTSGRMERVGKNPNSLAFLCLSVPSPQTYQCVSSQTQRAKEESRASRG